jgi:Fe-S-cluster containining protein
MDFPCIKCGLCCRTLPSIQDAVELNRGDGVCKYLKDNLCSIYPTRPIICNIESMYFSKFKDAMTETQFILMNLKSCYRIAKLSKNDKAANKIKKLLEG